MKKKVLGKDFFNRPTLTVARELLGKYLVRRVDDKTVALMITETEAYDGFNDLASHARRGKTPRNTPMYMEAGTIYVYFTYGMHWMLNLVCGKEEYPAAVLIRGVVAEGSEQLETSISQRDGARIRIFQQKNIGARREFVLTPPLNGPAKLTKFLKIDKSLNTLQLGKKAGLWVEDRGVTIKPSQIKRTPRIGIAYAGEYVDKPWRFVIVSSKNTKHN